MESVIHIDFTDLPRIIEDNKNRNYYLIQKGGFFDRIEVKGFSHLDVYIEDVSIDELLLSECDLGSFYVSNSVVKSSFTIKSNIKFRSLWMRTVKGGFDFTFEEANVTSISEDEADLYVVKSSIASLLIKASYIDSRVNVSTSEVGDLAILNSVIKRSLSLNDLRVKGFLFLSFSQFYEGLKLHWLVVRGDLALMYSDFSKRVSLDKSKFKGAFDISKSFFEGGVRTGFASIEYFPIVSDSAIPGVEITNHDRQETFRLLKRQH